MHPEKLAFYSDKKVLITGNTGFKGSWLSLMLKYLGANVFGFSLAPTDSELLFKKADLEKIIPYSVGNVVDYQSLSDYLHEIEPEIVFHLAAQPLVRQSYAQPLETYSTNVMGTANILHAVRSTPSVQSVVIVTSDKCYENMEWDWAYRENDPLGGHDPYSSSKACAELVTAAFRQSFFDSKTDPDVGIASARAGNVIGGGDWAVDRLIPDFIRAVSSGEPLVLRNPGSIRPWQYVLDVLVGYLMLGEKLVTDTRRFNTSWNFGPIPSEVQPVEWVINAISKYWGEGVYYKLPSSGANLYEAKSLRLDCSKTMSKLKWQPKYTLEKTLYSTADWYKAYLRGDNMLDFSIQQIETYFKQ